MSEKKFFNPLAHGNMYLIRSINHFKPEMAIEINLDVAIMYGLICDDWRIISSGWTDEKIIILHDKNFFKFDIETVINLTQIWSINKAVECINLLEQYEYIEIIKEKKPAKYEILISILK